MLLTKVSDGEYDDERTCFPTQKEIRSVGWILLDLTPAQESESWGGKIIEKCRGGLLSRALHHLPHAQADPGLEMVIRRVVEPGHPVCIPVLPFSAFWFGQLLSVSVKKAERQRIDAFELWFWRRLLRVPWTARRSNQSFLKEISPGISLEGMMLKLKLQYFGHLM